VELLRRADNLARIFCSGGIASAAGESDAFGGRPRLRRVGSEVNSTMVAVRWSFLGFMGLPLWKRVGHALSHCR